jgi:hypothetical protein
MKWAALITWVATAGGGFAMLGLWLKHGGLTQRTLPGQRIRPPLIFGHLALAATGLVIWIIYLAADKDALAWIALGVLAPVALLGFTMLAIWVQRRQGAAGTVGEPATAVAAAGGGTAGTGGVEPAEQRFPVPIVVLHGLLAVATVVLVLLTAAGVGGS